MPTPSKKKTGAKKAAKKTAKKASTNASAGQDFNAVFQILRGILEPYFGESVVVKDNPGEVYLNTHQEAPNGQPLFFAGIGVRAKYVSFYLFPVYTNPELLDGIRDDLRKRMQGKSCFNFKKADDPSIPDLQALVKKCVTFWRKTGVL